MNSYNGRLRINGISGFADVLVLVSMILLSVSLPVATRLVQQNQENRGMAASTLDTAYPCTSVMYTPWGPCKGDKQTKTLIYKTPENCVAYSSMSRSCECTNNDAKCSKGQMYLCTDGKWQTGDKCTSGECTKSGTACASDISTKTCTGGAVKGDYKCVGNVRYKCDSGTWVNKETCPYGCIEDKCASKPAIPPGCSASACGKCDQASCSDVGCLWGYNGSSAMYCYPASSALPTPTDCIVDGRIWKNGAAICSDNIAYVCKSGDKVEVERCGSRGCDTDGTCKEREKNLFSCKDNDQCLSGYCHPTLKVCLPDGCSALACNKCDADGCKRLDKDCSWGYNGGSVLYCYYKSSALPTVDPSFCIADGKKWPNGAAICFNNIAYICESGVTRKVEDCGTKGCEANGTCTGVEVGVCGGADKQEYYAASEFISNKGMLCSRGKVNWIDVRGVDGVFRWNCLSSDGTVGDNCTAKKKKIDNICGGAHKQEVKSVPEGAQLCSMGNVDWVEREPTKDGYYRWRCNFYDHVNECWAKLGLEPDCGGAVKVVLASYPSTDKLFLCKVGEPEFVGQNLEKGNYRWICKIGKREMSCESKESKIKYELNQVCGGAHEKIFDNPPSANENLCKKGSPTWTDKEATDGYFRWYCTVNGDRYGCWAEKKKSANSTASTSPVVSTASNKTTDINGDGVVNGIDLLLVKNAVSASGDVFDSAKKEDLNNDGVVNGIDFTLIKNALLSSVKNG